MKKSKKSLLFCLSAMLGCGVITTATLSQKEPLEPDNVEYEDELVADYHKAPIIKKAATNNYPNKVTLHYHNDDARCDKRAFYVWFAGVNGNQYAPDTVSSDKKDMTITFDFLGDHSFGYKRKMYLIVKGHVVGDWSEKTDDTPIDYAAFDIVDGKMDIWIIPGEAQSLELYASQKASEIDRVKSARFKDWKTIELISTTVPTSYKLYAYTKPYFNIDASRRADRKDYFLLTSGTVSGSTNVTFNSLPMKKWQIKLNYTVYPNALYTLETSFKNNNGIVTEKSVSFETLYDTARFNQYYTYSGDDLGATWHPSGTTFKVWAPTACNVKLMIYDSGTPSTYDLNPGPMGSTYDNCRGFNMAYTQGGVWQITVTNENLRNKFYKYAVTNALGTGECADPYAKACGVNGERSMVCDFSSTNPEGWDDVPAVWNGVTGYDIKTPNELSIYETHIRDLTMDESWNGTEKPGTFNAFVEKGTRLEGHSNVTTGFDHIEEMGVSAVQLEPVFDYDNTEDDESMVYNWGYNPLNYNCVEGGYSSDPFSGTKRITEFKNLVMQFANNNNHTRVIMDVVYNHVSSAPASCFNRLMPKYYFRCQDNGNYWNGSGCGNEVKTEAKMMSKYIVDSLCWWASEYKIKGFRFDLMGLIDYKTLDAAKTALYKIDPDIYLYGEGWTGDGQDAHMNNKNSGDPYYGNWGANTWTVYNKLSGHSGQCYLGCFNDKGRNSLKGENNINSMYGFISEGNPGDKSLAVGDLLIGKHHYNGDSDPWNPNQCINYASCHDNFALYDQFTYAFNKNGDNMYYPGVVCAAIAATECTILMSNGVAFIQGGEELFRTKEVTTEDYIEYKGVDTETINGHIISHNSYNLSDKTNAYKWGRKVSIDGVSTSGYVDAIKKAIELRKTLKKYTKEELNSHNPFSSSSDFNVWNNQSGSNCIAMKNGHYFFFVSGAANSSVPFNAINSATDVYCSNPYGTAYTRQSGVGISLSWATCVCLYC